MAGGEGSRRWTVAGEGGAMEASSAKRKAEAETVDGHLAPPLKEFATCGEAGKKDAGAGSVAVAGNAASRRPENLMSRREIRSILNPKPTQWPSPYHELRESNPSLIPLPGEEMDDERRRLYARAQEFQRMDDDDVKLREFVRKEMETKGYVEMDDDWVRRRAEVSAMIEETMKKARDLLIFDTEEEEEDDDDESDYDDEF